ncbi:MAG: glycosyltransferase [Bacteroidetes bacterium]|nr:glycosyltransferase [Bacteroidota bacterium]
MSRKLLFFTISFPHGSLEQSFIRNELKYLKEKFDQVIIVPSRINDEKHEFPSSLKVDESLANELGSVSYLLKIRTLISISFISELFRIKFNPSKIKRAVAARLEALITKEWLTNFFKTENANEFLIYTFWHNSSTLGAIYFKQDFRNIKVVSRCHNFDLYGNDENDYYVPFQKEIVESLDGLYPVSKDGENYIKSKFPLANCKASLMGVPAAKVDNKASNDGVYRIASCSYLIPRKRVELILKGAIEFATHYPNQKIEWTHIGDGPEIGKLLQLSNTIPTNLKIYLKGCLPNHEVLKYYENFPVDLFVNVSTKEGTPVSIMEAISFSIPVMASAFGGNKEIIEKGAGVLLPENPTTTDISNSLTKLIKSDQVRLRSNAKKVWEDFYNCEKNYSNFCIDLFSLT